MVGLIVLIIIGVTLYYAYQDGREGDYNASGFALLFSALFPLIGVITYFIQRDKVADANKYLKWAGIGFLIGIFCQILLP